MDCSGGVSAAFLFVPVMWLSLLEIRYRIHKQEDMIVKE